MTNEAEYRAKIMKGRFIFFWTGWEHYIYIKKTTQNKTKHIEKQI